MHGSHELDDEIEVLDLSMDLKYYDTNPPGIEDGAEASAGRIADELPLDEEERAEIRASLAKSLVLSPDSIQSLIGSAIIEEDYFGFPEHWDRVTDFESE